MKMKISLFLDCIKRASNGAASAINRISIMVPTRSEVMFDLFLSGFVAEIFDIHHRNIKLICRTSHSRWVLWFHRRLSLILRDWKLFRKLALHRASCIDSSYHKTPTISPSEQSLTHICRHTETHTSQLACTLQLQLISVMITHVIRLRWGSRPCDGASPSVVSLNSEARR